MGTRRGRRSAKEAAAADGPHRAGRAIGASHRKAERALERVLASTQKPVGVMPESNDERGQVSPTSTLARLKSNPSVDGLELESLEEFERSMMDFPSTETKTKNTVISCTICQKLVLGFEFTYPDN